MSGLFPLSFFARAHVSLCREISFSPLSHFPSPPPRSLGKTSGVEYRVTQKRFTYKRARGGGFCTYKPFLKTSSVFRANQVFPPPKCLEMLCMKNILLLEKYTCRSREAIALKRKKRKEKACRERASFAVRDIVCSCAYFYRIEKEREREKRETQLSSDFTCQMTSRLRFRHVLTCAAELVNFDFTNIHAGRTSDIFTKPFQVKLFNLLER